MVSDSGGPYNYLFEKVLSSDSNFVWSFVFRCPDGSKSNLVKVIAWHQSGGKASAEPIMIQFTEAYMGQQGHLKKYKLLNLGTLDWGRLAVGQQALWIH